MASRPSGVPNVTWARVPFSRFAQPGSGQAAASGKGRAERKSQRNVHFDNDAASTWHYSAGPSTLRPRRTCSDTGSTTAAQKIAAEYRKSRSRQDVLQSSNSSPVISRTSSVMSGAATSSAAHTDIVSLSEPKARYRESRAHAHEQYLQEAWTMFMGGRFEGDTCIRCHRRDCDDTLPSLLDLARHLHLHDVQPDVRTDSDKEARNRQPSTDITSSEGSPLDSAPSDERGIRRKRHKTMYEFPSSEDAARQDSPPRKRGLFKRLAKFTCIGHSQGSIYDA